MIEIDANSIIVRDRQRKVEVEIDETFIASVNKRLINPIVVRRENNEIILVAGFRRLTALIRGGTTNLQNNIHFRFFDDLSPVEAEIIEFEENTKRENFHWRDRVKATVRIHNLLNNDKKQTAERVNLKAAELYKILLIAKHLDSPTLNHAEGISHALAILQTVAERKSASIVNDITAIGNQLFNSQEKEAVHETDNSVPIDNMLNSSTQSMDSDESTQYANSNFAQNNHNRNSRSDNLIRNVSFLDWVQTYSGDTKFNLIHCDFPYGIQNTNFASSISSSDADYDYSNYWPLLESLGKNLDKFCSYSAHIMFWFSMEFYEKTRQALESFGLFVHRHPLVWHKTDNSGIVPGRDKQYPRRIYETAFLCSRGQRPLVKAIGNCYGAPISDKPIHPSQKPEPVLRHFLSGLIDETTDLFDPTCGSGTALRAADSLGARSVFGLELNSDYANAANAALNHARILRRAIEK